jgi:uncharacterized Zn finger protein
MRENADAKGRRYVSEGRLTVEEVGPDLVRATCKGSGRVHDCGWSRSLGWSCSCPSIGRCSHLVALMLVVVREELA